MASAAVRRRWGRPPVAPGGGGAGRPPRGGVHDVGSEPLRGLTGSGAWGHLGPTPRHGLGAWRRRRAGFAWDGGSARTARNAPSRHSRRGPRGSGGPRGAKDPPRAGGPEGRGRAAFGSTRPCSGPRPHSETPTVVLTWWAERRRAPPGGRGAGPHGEPRPPAAPLLAAPSLAHPTQRARTGAGWVGRGRVGPVGPAGVWVGHGVGRAPHRPSSLRRPAPPCASRAQLPKSPNQ